MNPLSSPRTPSPTSDYHEEIAKAQGADTSGRGHGASLGPELSVPPYHSIMQGMGSHPCIPRNELVPKENLCICLPRGPHLMPHLLLSGGGQGGADSHGSSSHPPSALQILPGAGGCRDLHGRAWGLGQDSLTSCPRAVASSRKASRLRPQPHNFITSLSVGPTGELALSIPPSLPTAALAGPALPGVPSLCAPLRPPLPLDGELRGGTQPPALRGLPGAAAGGASVGPVPGMVGSPTALGLGEGRSNVPAGWREPGLPLLSRASNLLPRGLPAGAPWGRPALPQPGSPSLSCPAGLASISSSPGGYGCGPAGCCLPPSCCSPSSLWWPACSSPHTSTWWPVTPPPGSSSPRTALPTSASAPATPSTAA